MIILGLQPLGNTKKIKKCDHRSTICLMDNKIVNNKLTSRRCVFPQTIGIFKSDVTIHLVIYLSSGEIISAFWTSLESKKIIEKCVGKKTCLRKGYSCRIIYWKIMNFISK